ncbi:Protein Wnt-16 [Folsomia candida]|uniref:Protein Wnt n=1 Tax=Folsomia candida TaxID=158441 RepID=A0A226DLP1_FOLCA|nr:Protein Wnt-16 [Folsomia candida]
MGPEAGYLGISTKSLTVPADQPVGDVNMQLAGDAPENPEEAFRYSAGLVCSSLPGLVAQQIDVCQNYPDTIQAVSDGARRGIRECQFQFRHERWNCSTKEDDDYSVFGHELSRGSKETAFIYAVTSAGVVHAITQSCSSGALNECSCDLSKQGRTTPEGWKWGGCSDNMKFGIQFSRKFVDAPDKTKLEYAPKNVQNLMNLHNNEAGRQAVAHLMRMQCRCHGVSGSCELKTCWKNIPSFTQVGDYLKKKYQKSTQVPLKSQKRLRRKSGRKFPVSKGELVHLRKSPDYCELDLDKGITGTTGRVCNKTSDGPDRCNVLCCGRGFNTKVVKKVERCQWTSKKNMSFSGELLHPQEERGF